MVIVKSVGLVRKAKIIVGGASNNDEWTKKIGDHVYGENATEALAEAKKTWREIVERAAAKSPLTGYWRESNGGARIGPELKGLMVQNPKSP